MATTTTTTTTTGSTTTNTTTTTNPNTTTNITVVLIDVQNDFHPGGTLAIPTANDDAQRIVNFITKYIKNISNIIVTMDTHPKIHIAHPLFWINPISKHHPTVFTIITTNDILTKKWIPYQSHLLMNDTINDFDTNIFNDKTNTVVVVSDSDKNDNDTSSKEKEYQNSSVVKIDLTQYCIEYTKQLENNNKFLLCIWPEHCLLGSTGHCIVPIIQESLYDWTTCNNKNVMYIQKGYNPLTEMYSVMSAEVPISHLTSYNTKLQYILQNPITSTSTTTTTTTTNTSDSNTTTTNNNTKNIIVIAGQAMSHCVNYSVRDIIQNWNIDTTTSTGSTTNETGSTLLTEMYILIDCMSPVPGFEHVAEQFQKDVQTVSIPNILHIYFIKSIDFIL